MERRIGVAGLLLGLLGSWNPGQEATDQEEPLRASLPRDHLPRPLYSGQVPSGMPEISYPAENPYRKAAVELGRLLFFDPILSADRTTSCASCHQPEHGFSSPEALPVGVHGQRALRHPPTLFNRAYGTKQSWDGRSDTLEQQVLLPIENPVEMDLPLAVALERLRSSDDYAARFQAAFPKGEVDRRNLARALASFVRHLLLGDSPVDRFRAGEISGLSKAERAGLWLFESKAGCWKCHASRNFTDESFHNTGIGVRDGEPEEGRFAITERPQDRGRFKTPTLRGAALRPPYMHDGSVATLREVVEFYRRGGNPNSHLDERLMPLELSDADVGHLVAFLQALSRTRATPPRRRDV